MGEGTQFGPYVAFDNGQCTVAGCDTIWQKYGFVVGCQHIPYNQGMWAAYCTPQDGKCRRGHWYSLPGPCPSHNRWDKKWCAARNDQQGGACDKVTGDRDCT